MEIYGRSSGDEFLLFFFFGLTIVAITFFGSWVPAIGSGTRVLFNENRDVVKLADSLENFFHEDFLARVQIFVEIRWLRFRKQYFDSLFILREDSPLARG